MYILKYMIRSVTAIVLVVTLFSCGDNYDEIRQFNQSDYAPITEGREVNLKYTDSGKMVANLLTPRLLDFSNYAFSFSEYPDGVEVHFWDEEGNKSVITSDYGVQYDKTNLIDLRGNVVLRTSDSLELYADQLYWNQESQWLFTDRPYTIKFKDGSSNDGAGFDSNEDFDIFLSRSNVGVQYVDDNSDTDE